MEVTPTILSTLELNGLEKSFSLDGGWLIIAHVAHLTGKTTLLNENMFDAISHLLKRHPRMRTRLRIQGFQRYVDIFDYDKDYFNANLFYSIMENDNQPWQKLVEHLCNKCPYQNNESLAFPLFHFIVLCNGLLNSSDQQTFHLILLSNHIVSDGRSGMILINDLLTFITSDNLKQHVEPVNTQIIPCIADIIPRPWGIFFPVLAFIGKYIFKRRLRQLRHSKIPVKIEHFPNLSTPYRFQPVKIKFLFGSTSTSLYSGLHSKCRSQRVTLHGPLMACLVLAIDRCFSSHRNFDQVLDSSIIDIDFDLRTRLPGSPLKKNTVGFCISFASIELEGRVPLNRTLFWEFSRKCLRKTNEAVDNGDAFLGPHLFKKITGDQQTFEELINETGDGRIGEVNFSNIGKYPYPTDYNNGQVKLQGLHVVNNTPVCHVLMVLFVTCAGNEQLDISLAHELESSEKAQEFLNFFIGLIESAADSDAQTTLEQLLEHTKTNRLAE